MVDVRHPAAQEALFGLPSLVAADGCGGFFVDRLVAMGQGSCHSTDRHGVVLHADRDEAAEDVGNERCRWDGDTEAVGPQTRAVGHHVFEEGSLEVPASSVQTRGVWAERVQTLLHRPDQRERLDE